MPQSIDGPSTNQFMPLALADGMPPAEAAERLQPGAPLGRVPEGACVGWGIPFDLSSAIVLEVNAIEIPAAVRAGWLVFAHTAAIPTAERDAHGLPLTKDGVGQLGTLAATYIIRYADGTEEALPIRLGYELASVSPGWGQGAFEAVTLHKPFPMRAHHEQPHVSWGFSQFRVTTADYSPWVTYLSAWRNPHPEREIAGIRLEPGAATVLLAGISAGEASSHPTRWETRRKALLRLPAGTAFDPALDEDGLLRQIQLDMGQVISTAPRLAYPNEIWADTDNNAVPAVRDREVVVEYAAHPDARFHLADGTTIPLAEVGQSETLTVIAPATRRVTLRALDESGRPVAVKLHLHGAAGEYLAPVDRHRIPNAAWFEDYSVDFVHQNRHACTYIPGETTVDLPLGPVYLEISKGFEIRPIRRVIDVTPATETIDVTIETVLPWRARGWVTADTHVHFLSPTSARLEGAGEGVNVVNLLASQWGELMTNVGDFDGQTVGDGEYLVRVGTENRQHVLGHISLLGYDAPIIAPMTTGGPDESALGDPVGALLTEWARQCKAQNGVVVIPHFPNPRGEHAATIVSGDADGVEMTSWGDLYSGISPYSLVDWYRYLNCGYRVAAVGGTDKMNAQTAVGTVRTYAHLGADAPFTYDAWKDAVRQARTFVSYGPLLEMTVNGQPLGSRISLPAGGGTLDVAWQVASVTVPMSRVEVVVNGEIRESLAVEPWAAAGHCSVKLPASGWVALLVRGHYADKPEIIAAHSSPVMVEAGGAPILAVPDAVSILRQIEGALAYLDTVGTRAEIAAYQRMRLVLTSVHRALHNRMHQEGQYHPHTPVDDHHH